MRFSLGLSDGHGQLSSAVGDGDGERRTGGAKREGGGACSVPGSGHGAAHTTGTGPEAAAGEVTMTFDRGSLSL